MPEGLRVKQPYRPGYGNTHLIPIATEITSCHRNQVVHAFDPSPREEYKTRDDNSQRQSYFEIPGGRIAISDWGESKSQRLAVLLFKSSGWTPSSDSEFILIMFHPLA